MPKFAAGVVRFQKDVYPQKKDLFEKLDRDNDGLLRKEELIGPRGPGMGPGGPGKGRGPGAGMSGACVNHKTDIWYSYITMSDFRKIDMNFVSGGDPEHDLDVTGRPKALVPMSLPMRLTDNDTVNTDNLLVELGEDGYPVEDENGDWIPILNPDTDADGDSDGTHAYGYRVSGLCSGFHEFINNAGDLKRVCITEDGRLLDGDTGASRPNLFLQTYTKSDGTKSAWAIMAYEETKGAGSGSPDHDSDDGNYGAEPVIEEGKNAIYHSFDFQSPDKVNKGTIINLPERDENGDLVYLREVSLDADGNVVYGDLVLDYRGLPQLAYENARRPRFMLQGKSAMGSSNTPLIILSAMDSLDDVIAGLRMGADDYMTKPFSNAEVLDAVRGEREPARGDPAVGGPDSDRETSALGGLDWMVCVDLWQTETANFWRNPNVANSKDIRTEVFLLPAAASFEKEGSISRILS